jgi:hypothetical protein
MDKRIEELKILVKTYGKESHTSALNSAYRLRQRLITLTSHHNIQASVFQADATAKNAFTAKLGNIKVDIVIADIPYGIHSSWRRSNNSPQNPIVSMLENLRLVLSSKAVVAVAADKRSRITHPSYERIERFNIGKRRITLLSPEASS